MKKVKTDLIINAVFAFIFHMAAVTLMVVYYDLKLLGILLIWSIADRFSNNNTYLRR